MVMSISPMRKSETTLTKMKAALEKAFYWHAYEMGNGEPVIVLISSMGDEPEIFTYNAHRWETVKRMMGI